jgi:adenylate cyclase
VSPADRPDVAEAAEAADIDLPSLLESVESAILGGPRRYTPAEVSERAGLDRDEARGLWRALGFPTVGDDEVMFNDADVEALREMATLAQYGFADESLRLAVARLFGQTFSRLASYQGQLLLEEIGRHPELLSSGDRLIELVEEVTPRLERLQGYAWRRQLAAYLARMAAQGPEDFGAASAPVSIGFADMSGFTSLTRKATEMELRELLDCFETMSTEVVGDHGGRIVKTIGDEILFQVEDPACGAEIALDLIDAVAAAPNLPELRAGLAYGDVVSRLGDVYGSTVNIASRLTSISRPGWVLIDRELHDVLEGDDRFRLKSRRPESVRGYHHLRQWRLRRAER